MLKRTYRQYRNLAICHTVCCNFSKIRTERGGYYRPLDDNWPPLQHHYCRT